MNFSLSRLLSFSSFFIRLHEPSFSAGIDITPFLAYNKLWIFLKTIPEKPSQLSKESWDHIRERHPEISKDMIKQVLIDPDEVLASPVRPEVELYFCLRSLGPRGPRFTLVVVKNIRNESWITTSMTKDKISEGDSIYKRGVKK